MNANLKGLGGLCAWLENIPRKPRTVGGASSEAPGVLLGFESGLLTRPCQSWGPGSLLQAFCKLPSEKPNPGA